MYLAPTHGWPRRNFVKMFDADKTRMIGLPCGKKLWQYVKPFSSDTGTLRIDRQTDRRTDKFAISISRVSVLTRDKKTQCARRFVLLKLYYWQARSIARPLCDSRATCPSRDVATQFANPVDYSTWGIIQERVYRSRINDVKELTNVCWWSGGCWTTQSSQQQRLRSDVVVWMHDQIKNLGILLDDRLSFRDHINDKINKAFSMLGIIKRNFKHLTIQSCYIKTW